MYILNIFLIITLLFYLYLTVTLFLKVNKLIYHTILILIYILMINIMITTLNDMYYFYLSYKLINISIYVLLIIFSNNSLNFKAVITYYFLRFIGSILFILGLYNLSYNN